MFGSAILEVAIGLIFVFLIVSLMVTAVTELLASVFKWRSQTLYLGIQSLVDAGKGTNWGAKLYQHPLIQTLCSSPTAQGDETQPKQGPSYIPSRTFVVALLDSVRTAAREEILAAVAKIADPAAKEAQDVIAALPLHGAAGDRVKAELQQLLARAASPAELQKAAAQLFDKATDPQVLDLLQAKLGNTHLGRTLAVLRREAADDLTQLKTQLETWFNGAMDRVSGWYKRKTQWVHLLLAVGLTLGMNVDALLVVRSLSQDSTLRQTIVAQAEGYAQKPQLDAEDFTTLRGKLNGLDLPVGWQAVPPLLPPAVGQLAAPDPDYRHAPFQKLSDLVSGQAWVNFGNSFLFHFWGWLLTAIAVSLGAPFWFDMLKRVIAIRSSGASPAEAAAKKAELALAAAPPVPTP